ncbi:hypothetical protein PNA2_0948 [Pyrococcus sp. NA2]|uniref:hypothetical protein n=1 Tax=Pyrococcus sp. (strain NA2) TaxID=342949 RepID=UPI000209A91C|nr:hypothetical protein [Pyrococcus sp. NA2]AEC51865.1 hypothetical protein PNA2_0948 [Pyrococcus sp. NA2]
MLVEIATYSPINPPKFPIFKVAKVEIQGNNLIFHIKPSGSIEINLKAIIDVTPLTLNFFKPPRKAILIRLTNFNVLVTIGKNPLAYERDSLLRFVSMLYSTLLGGVIVNYEGKPGTLRIVRRSNGMYDLALVTESKVISISDWRKIENYEVSRRVKELLELLEFLGEEEQEE